MQITFEPKRTEVFEDVQCVYWTITDDALVEYPWWGNVPLEVDIQAHLEAHLEEYWALILQRMYPPEPAPPDEPVVEPREEEEPELRNVTQPEAEPLIYIEPEPEPEPDPLPTSNPGEATWDVAWPVNQGVLTLEDHENRIAALEGV